MGREGSKPHSAETLRNVLCAPKVDAGARQNNGSSLGTTVLIPFPPTIRAPSQERDPWSHSQAVTKAHHRALLPSWLLKGVWGRGGAMSGWHRGGRARRREYFSWATGASWPEPILVTGHKIVPSSVGVTSPPPGSPLECLPPVWPHRCPCPDTGGSAAHSCSLPITALLPRADPTSFTSSSHGLGF